MLGEQNQCRGNNGIGAASDPVKNSGRNIVLDNGVATDDDGPNDIVYSLVEIAFYRAFEGDAGQADGEVCYLRHHRVKGRVGPVGNTSGFLVRR